MKIIFKGSELELGTLDMNQLIEVEEKFGSLTNLGKEGVSIPLKIVRFIAYVSVKKLQPAVTEEEVGANLDLVSMKGIMQLLSPVANVAGERPLEQA